MKQKKIVRAVCLFLAILMVVSVMGSVLVTMARRKSAGDLLPFGKIGFDWF